MHRYLSIGCCASWALYLVHLLRRTKSFMVLWPWNVLQRESKRDDFRSFNSETMSEGEWKGETYAGKSAAYCHPSLSVPPGTPWSTAHSDTWGEETQAAEEPLTHLTFKKSSPSLLIVFPLMYKKWKMKNETVATLPATLNLYAKPLA